MFGMLYQGIRSLSTGMYMLADDLGLIDVESIYSNKMKGLCGKMSCIADSVPMAMGNVRKPLTDIVETDEEIILTLEMPGVEKEAIEITATDDELSVLAKKTEAPEMEDENVQKCERSYGLFRRDIKLPCGIKREQAKADLNNGLLTITLPKENVITHTKITID
jgi:HSP20 family protein